MRALCVTVFLLFYTSSLTVLADPVESDNAAPVRQTVPPPAAVPAPAAPAPGIPSPAPQAAPATPPVRTASTPQPPLPSIPHPHAYALSLLQALNAKLSAAKAITYTLSATYSFPMYPSQNVQITSTGTTDKSGLYYFSFTSPGGGINSVYDDGKNISVFDADSATYCVQPVGTDELENRKAFMSEELAVSGQNPSIFIQMQLALALPTSLRSGRFMSETNPTLSSKFDTLNGKQVVDVSETNKSIMSYTQTLVIDPSTGLPVATNLQLHASATVDVSLQESITNFQLLTASADASTFSFSPPANAKLVTAAKLPTGGVASTADTLPVGLRAPNFSVLRSNGGQLSLSQFAGKVVVIDFWATWCGPCQASLPHTDIIAKDYERKGVVFLPICTWDDKSSFTSWRKAHRSMFMTFYYDPAGQNEDSSVATKLYKVDGIPTQYVIGKTGKVVASFVGYDDSSDPTEADLKKAIVKALKGF